MKRIAFLVFPNFQVMGFAALSAFEISNLVAHEAAYDIRMVSEHGGKITSSFGMPVETYALGKDDVFDTIIVGGGLEPQSASPELQERLRSASTYARRLASICTGAFVLAEAGFLDGRRATTHWLFAQQMADAFPSVRVESDRIFISDGPIWTSAGMSAGIDLALGMIEEDLGRETAREVAKKLVIYHRRAGGQTQHSTLLELEPKSDRVQRALAFARRHLKTELSVDSLADAAGLSVRQFSRVFMGETGQSPAKAVEKLRVEAARTMMEEGRHPLVVIARETGFADRERMRQAFLRTLGQPPQSIQRASRFEGAGLKRFRHRGKSRDLGANRLRSQHTGS